MRIGFIGAGKMALALARGFAEKLKPSAVMASSPATDEALLQDFKSHGFDTSYSNEYVVRNSDTVIFATKPFVFPTILKELFKSFHNKHTIMSVAAGIKIRTIEKSLHKGDQLKVIRVMPNTPSLINEGVTVYSANSNCNEDDIETAKTLLSSVGQCFYVKESQIDAVTGLSGSGPGYMFLIIEALADAGVRQGLPRDIAYKLAAQTMVGSGKMVLETGTHPAVLKDAVCSPGGSTIAAIESLEKGGLRATIMKAVEAAVDRCNDMGK